VRTDKGEYVLAKPSGPYRKVYSGTEEQATLVHEVRPCAVARVAAGCRHPAAIWAHGILLAASWQLLGSFTATRRCCSLGMPVHQAPCALPCPAPWQDCLHS
jgi:hypothetical protein